MDLAEWIIDDFCLVFLVFASISQDKTIYSCSKAYSARVRELSADVR